MIYAAVAILCVFVMSFFNACMDAWENAPNFDESIFKHWNKKFWCKDVSWQYAKKILGLKLDAWHLAKWGMLISFACTVVACIYLGSYLLAHHSPKFIVLALIVNAAIGATWFIGFNLFYHKLFKVK